MAVVDASVRADAGSAEPEEIDAESLALGLLHATQAAAVASLAWVGRGDRKAADGAAVAAMRAALRAVRGRGRVVIGEGEKDEAPMLYCGEEIGDAIGAEFGLAVDPLEGTNFCARGSEGAISVAAGAPAGALWSTSAYYMDKIVVGAAAAGAIDITASIKDNLKLIGAALDKPVDEIVVLVLDKPRHHELIPRVRAAGARVIEISDGDVMGALRVLLPQGDADVTLGVGGAPEGVVTACAVRLLGGDMQARLAPQRPDERARLDVEGADLAHVLTVAELCSSAECAFVATGVTSSELLVAPARTPAGWRTSSIVVTPLHGAMHIDALVPTSDCPTARLP